MYGKKLPINCCIGDREGIEWPVGAKKIQWWNGVETVLPWVEHGDKVVRNSLIMLRSFSYVLLQNPDVELVENMAQGFDGLMGDDDGNSLVVSISLAGFTMQRGIGGLTGKLADGVSPKAVLLHIRAALSQGKCMVLHQWKSDGPSLQCDEDSIKLLQGSLDQTVKWQCQISPS